MKNMKVRTKLNLILVLVILLVALGSVVSVKNNSIIYPFLNGFCYFCIHITTL